MKPTPATNIAKKRFQVEELHRRVSAMEDMIANWVQQNTQLEQEVSNEERKTNNSDPDHYRYSTYAKAQRARRDTNLKSMASLQEPLEQARKNLATARDELLVLEGKPVGEPVPA